jgi:multidrug efflux system outer membrane protein
MGLLSSLFIILSFSACMTVGPDYTAPKMDAPDKWHSTSSENISTERNDSNLAKWWESFNDPILTDLIKRAVSDNLSIKEAVLRLNEARIRRGVTGADKYPSVSSSASVTKSHSSGMSNTFYQLGFDANWEIDLFGGIKRSIEASDADLESSKESLRDVTISLISEVALNYVQLRLYQSELDITNSNLKAQEETHEIVTWRYQAGMVTELDLKKSEYSLEQTRAQLPAILLNIEQAENKIAVLMGTNPGELKDLLDPVRAVPVVQDKIKTGIPADLLRQRPDLRKAERDLAAQTARIGVAESDLYPAITLSGSLKASSSALSSLTDSNSISRSIGPSISWPVFRAGAIKKNVEIQTTVADQLLVQYKSLLLSAVEEVENALSSCFYQQIKNEYLRKACNAAQRAYELAKIQYSAGLVDFQVLLEAQRTLLSLQDQVTQGEGQVSINYITLYKALGGGWSSLSTDF